MVAPPSKMAFGVSCGMLLATLTNASWNVERSEDPMHGTLITTATALSSQLITDSIGSRHRPTLAIRCSRDKGTFGEIEIYVVFDNRLFVDSDETHVEWRIDNGVVQEEFWEPSGSELAAFVPQPQRLLPLLRKGATFHLQVFPLLWNRQYTTFSLAGSSAAIAAVTSSCTPPKAERLLYLRSLLKQAEDMADPESQKVIARGILELVPGDQEALDSIGRAQTLSLAVLLRFWREAIEENLGGVHQSIYNGLLLRDRLEGSPMGWSDELPISTDALFDELRSYMLQSKTCIYFNRYDEPGDPGPSGCPTFFTAMYFLDFDGSTGD